MNNLDDLIRALHRNSEIVALSIALQGKNTCDRCGLFATVRFMALGGAYWIRADGNSFIYPAFCDSCREVVPATELQGEGEEGKFEPVPSAMIAARLNALLKSQR